MGPGAVLRVDPWTHHSFTYFENPAIPIGGNFQAQAS